MGVWVVVLKVFLIFCLKSGLSYKQGPLPFFFMRPSETKDGPSTNVSFSKLPGDGSDGRAPPMLLGLD